MDNILYRHRLPGSLLFPMMIGMLSCLWTFASSAQSQGVVTSREFAREVERVLPEEAPYAYHRRLSESPVHTPGRTPGTSLQSGEIAIPDQSWTLAWNKNSSVVLNTAVEDFRDYLEVSMNVNATPAAKDSLEDWQGMTRCIVVGTRDQLPGCGNALDGPKDYEIIAGPERLLVCGYDERGAMFGLYNLEARMNLREAPFLPADLNTIRYSLYDTRMVHSWMGWMDWPDKVLSHLVHDGFDGIFASCYANPTGDRTAAETVTDFYGRMLYLVRGQDPTRMRNLIDRAARFGLKVYAPVIYRYMGDQRASGAAYPDARHAEGFPGHTGLYPADRGLLVQAMGRRPRCKQGVPGGLGAKLEPGSRNRGGRVSFGESGPRNTALGI